MLGHVKVAVLTCCSMMADSRKNWALSVLLWERVSKTAQHNSITIPKKVMASLKAARLKHASQLRSAGDLEAAEAVLQQVLSAEPNEVIALTRLAELAYSRKDWDQSIRRWEQVLEVAEQGDRTVPQKATDYLKTARLKHASQLNSIGEIEAAEEILQRVLSTEPSDLSVLSRFAAMAAARKDWAQAVLRWERVLEVAEQIDGVVPNQALTGLKTARIQHASQLSSIGEIEAAEEILQRVLSMEPSDLTALTHFAELAFARKDWAQAIQRWEKRLDAQRENITSMLIKLSIAYRHEGDVDKAIGVLNSAKGCGFYSDALIFHLTKLHTEKNEWETAAVLIRRAIEEKTIFHQLGFAAFAARVFWHIGDIQQANAILDRAMMESNPDEINSETKAIAKEIRSRLDSPLQVDSSEVSKTYYDEVYRHSKKYKSNAIDSIYIPVWKTISDVINRRAYKSILDLGCGPGQFADYILQHHPQITYTGVDFSNVAVQTARKRCPNATFIEKNLLSSDFSLKWDSEAIFLLEVLEHIENDIALLEKIPSKKEVICSVPNFDSFSHVRFFKDMNDVKQRYKSVFLNLTITPISIQHSSAIFLMLGVKS